jgi:hypothetical protein
VGPQIGTWEGELERGKRLPEVSRHSIVTRGSPDTSGKVHIAAAFMRDGEFCSDCHGGRSRLSYRTVDLWYNRSLDCIVAKNCRCRIAIVR